MITNSSKRAGVRIACIGARNQHHSKASHSVIIAFFRTHSPLVPGSNHGGPTNFTPAPWTLAENVATLLQNWRNRVIISSLLGPRSSGLSRRHRQCSQLSTARKAVPYLGKVRTPSGPGTLLQVFAEPVTVLLDAEFSLCKFFPACRDRTCQLAAALSHSRLEFHPPTPASHGELRR
jgi:hypothetical protein